MTSPKFNLYFLSPCFDRIVPAVLALDFLEARWRWQQTALHPANYDRRSTTKLVGSSAVVDFLYHPDAEFCADHHATTFLNDDLRKHFLNVRHPRYILIYMFLLRVIDALNERKIPYALAGGYAVALHGAWRGTIDIDLVVRLTQKDFEAIESALLSIGLKSRLPVSAAEVFRFRREYIQNRNLIAWSFTNPDQPSEIVDILIPYDLRASKRISISFKGRRIQVLSLKDLMDMKKKSDRPQDQEDVKALRLLAAQKRSSK